MWIMHIWVFHAIGLPRRPTYCKKAMIFDAYGFNLMLLDSTGCQHWFDEPATDQKILKIVELWLKFPRRETKAPLSHPPCFGPTTIKSMDIPLSKLCFAGRILIDYREEGWPLSLFCIFPQEVVLLLANCVWSVAYSLHFGTHSFYFGTLALSQKSYLIFSNKIANMPIARSSYYGMLTYYSLNKLKVWLA